MLLFIPSTKRSLIMSKQDLSTAGKIAVAIAGTAATVGGAATYYYHRVVGGGRDIRTFEEREIDRLVEEEGYSKKEAKRIVAWMEYEREMIKAEKKAKAKARKKEAAARVKAKKAKKTVTVLPELLSQLKREDLETLIAKLDESAKKVEEAKKEKKTKKAEQRIVLESLTQEQIDALVTSVVDSPEIRAKFEAAVVKATS